MALLVVKEKKDKHNVYSGVLVQFGITTIPRCVISVWSDFIEITSYDVSLFHYIFIVDKNNLYYNDVLALSIDVTDILVNLATFTIVQTVYKFYEL